MALLRAFLDTPLDAWLEGNDGSVSPAEARPRVLELARSAVRDIPAYAAIHPTMPPSFEEYDASWPFLGKAEFVNRFPMSERCRGQSGAVLETLHASSGSSGAPTFWGRTTDDELMTAARFEQVMRDNFQAHELRTLAVIAFPLGSWVGGVFTYNCLRYLTLKGYNITQVTPGNNMEEILKVLQALAPSFQQTVILGYPPFVKGVVDKGLGQGLPWGSYRMGFVFAGEVFSEEFRALVARRAGLSESDGLTRVVSIYGTADAGVLGVETPLSATIRQWLSQRPHVMHELFKGDRVPSLFQYDPLHRYFEIKPDDKTLALTTMPALARAAPVSASAPAAPSLASELEAACSRLVLPSIRYAIGDVGGLMGFDELLQYVKDKGFDLPLTSLPLYRRLPFVWVFGRAHWTVSLYGANVFVENVMPGLEKAEVAALVTGKFILAVNPDPEDCRLLLRIELAPSITGERASPSALADISTTLTSSITAELLRLNSEYAHYVPQDKQQPKLVLHMFGDAQYFPQGVKHKYI